jgi:tripartite-type tricarboxylate transporter receptor subunit TctC
VARLEGQGVVAATSTPQEFAALIRKNLVRWRKIVKDANINR